MEEGKDSNAWAQLVRLKKLSIYIRMRVLPWMNYCYNKWGRGSHTATWQNLKCEGVKREDIKKQLSDKNWKNRFQTGRFLSQELCCTDFT
jgi:hypothetical protein